MWDLIVSFPDHCLSFYFSSRWLFQLCLLMTQKICPRTCSSMSDWADHLSWYEDGRFSNHQYFKFVVHNMILRRAAEIGRFIVNQKLGDSHLSVAD